MALEALQAQAGHRSISATQIYLHLANDWLAGEYHRHIYPCRVPDITGRSTRHTRRYGGLCACDSAVFGSRDMCGLRRDV
jgi:hypothetical protein